jgi:RNA polymerase sigma-70 factor (ECF subfamily)
MWTKNQNSSSLSRELAERRFVALYEENADDLLAYARRRIPVAEDAADLVAETFLVVWRRLGEVPHGAEARLWLYGVARLTLSNHRRGELRRTRLAQRLRSELTAAALASPPTGESEAPVMRALGTLNEADRELLLLAGWEELAPRQIARVLGIGTIAARSRLHRARRRLHEAMAALEPEQPESGKLECRGVR